MLCLFVRLRPHGRAWVCHGVRYVVQSKLMDPVRNFRRTDKTNPFLLIVQEMKARCQGQLFCSPPEVNWQLICSCHQNGLTLLHCTLKWLVPQVNWRTYNRRFIKSSASCRIELISGFLFYLTYPVRCWSCVLQLTLPIKSLTEKT